MSTQLPSFFRTVIVVGLLLCIITWSSGLRYPVEIPTAVAQPLETPAISEVTPEPPEHYLTFGLIPVAPTVLFDGNLSSEEPATASTGGVMAAGLLVRFEPQAPSIALWGLEFSACAVGRVLDTVVDLGKSDSAPGFYFRLGGGVRWRIPILEPSWYLNLGFNGGVLLFLIPEYQDTFDPVDFPTFGGLGFYINPLAVGMEWTLPDTRWTIGFRIEVLELGVAFPIPKPSGDDPVASQYLLLSAGRTTLMASVFF